MAFFITAQFKRVFIDLQMSNSLKAFDRWNEKKKITHKSKKVPYFKAGEIWWVQLGKNVSSESLGKGVDFLRPAVVLQKFYGKSALIIPLTTHAKEGEYYVFFHDSKGTPQTALLPQVRYVDGKRLKHKLSHVPEKAFQKIQATLWRLIKNNPHP